ncbi:deoxyribonuclease-1-like isoform X1 [Bufo bufo]|uniref:deoxyribonuclease-1-like isoform X1 n=1 Tax=Bufo bufo TaxID=8384 RepID=UPI001ABE7DC5|nr:deoxyribonuclease-1-like isoform X1 [Bufo bufo]XP_040260963.1 deoxyribonuclease-1-like isoform X1 [Bufo bufo]XP_040260964.1 deoxyribonuclease-1-like isoform X1 [Bufo bufo]
MKTYLLLLLLVLGLQVSATFKICAFNIKSFGEAKASNKKIMGVLVKILSRCDISVIQEVRDSKGEAVPALVNELNRLDGVHHYQHLESKRLGKNSYKEQIVFIYRADTVKVLDWYQYVEDHPDHPEAFAREPFAVRFHSPTTVIKDFALMSHHTCPSRAASEITRLLQVMLQVKSRWKIESLMLLGDLNAACGYVTGEAWRNIQHQSSGTFHWLIGDKDDTTVKEKTHCAYDRIVVHGEELLKGIVPASAKPFNFKKKLGLSEEAVRLVLLLWTPPRTNEFTFPWCLEEPPHGQISCQELGSSTFSFR